MQRALPDSVLRIAVLVLLLAGFQQLGQGLVIRAKAYLAPVLIERAWDETLAAGGVIKPWSWADTWPVARLRVPGQNVELMVLSGDSGNALAFGPGHSPATAALGSQGLAVIGGHRDTHFSFLQYLQLGESIYLDLADGRQQVYQVDGIEVVDSDRARLPASQAAEQLLLVTCYPFDTLQTGGALRYVVSSSPVSQSEAPAHSLHKGEQVYPL